MVTQHQYTSRPPTHNPYSTALSQSTGRSRVHLKTKIKIIYQTGWLVKYNITYIRSTIIPFELTFSLSLWLTWSTKHTQNGCMHAWRQLTCQNWSRFTGLKRSLPLIRRQQRSIQIQVFQAVSDGGQFTGDLLCAVIVSTLQDILDICFDCSDNAPECIRRACDLHLSRFSPVGRLHLCPTIWLRAFPCCVLR